MFSAAASSGVSSSLLPVRLAMQVAVAVVPVAPSVTSGVQLPTRASSPALLIGVS